MENLQIELARDASFLGLQRAKGPSDFYRSLFDRLLISRFGDEHHSFTIIDDPSKPIGATAEWNETNQLQRVVFGGGFEGHFSKCPTGFIPDYFVVRGYLTLNRLSQMTRDQCVVGEPALLASLLELTPIAGEDIIYLRSNFQHDMAALKQDLSQLGAAYIDLDEQFELLIQRIKSASIVISDGVIGLALADTFGVPNVWHSNGGLAGNEFEVMDYFSSVGRPLHQKLARIPSDKKTVQKLSNVAASEIVEVRADQLLEKLGEVYRLQLSLEPTVVLESTVTLGEEPVESKLPGKGIRDGILEIDYVYSGSKEDRQALLAPDLVAEDGGSVDGMGTLPGFFKSPNNDIGFFNYLHLEPGSGKTEIEISLPSGIWCSGFRVLRWSDTAEDIQISKITLNKFR